MLKCKLKNVFIKKNRKKALKFLIGILIVAGVLGLLVYKVKRDQYSLEVTFYHLRSDKVADGFRIVQLTDLHLREFGEKNIELVERIKLLKPDIIAISGDMNMSNNDDYHVVAELCEQLVDIADVYYVMGNHEFADFANRKTNIDDVIRETGAHLLMNESETVTVNGNQVKIGGLVTEPENYEERGGKDFMEKYIDGEDFKLLLVHYPEYFLGVIEDLPIDLALCGHTHGGIVRIPYVGGLYASEQGFFPQLTEGMSQIRNSVVIVGRGLGQSNSIPRINNNPEIVVVDVNWY